MPSRSRPSLIYLRALVLALFALSLVVQPVLAAAGELHELAHDPSGQHAGIDTCDSASARDTDDDATMLHALLQCAHCCGSGAAMVPLFKSVAGNVGADVVAGTAFLILPAARLPGPFKPPIFV